VSASASPAPVKGHCPSCGSDRLADVVGHHHSRYDDEEIWGKIDYRILRCRGCESVYFQKDEIFSEDVDYEVNPHTGELEGYIPHRITHWPKPPAASERVQPAWASQLLDIDNDLDSLFNEIYVALNNNLRVLSAIGVRTAFDRASELLGVDPAKSFADKLSKLVQLGKTVRAKRTRSMYSRMQETLPRIEGGGRSRRSLIR
jgi:hypothetical protein